MSENQKASPSVMPMILPIRLISSRAGRLWPESDAEDFPDINSKYHNIDKVNGSKDEHIYEDQCQTVCRSNAAPCPRGVKFA